MTRIFNTAFESELRSLLILSVFKDLALSLVQITLLDFITIYGKSFGVSTYNLHGDNTFRFSEYSARRAMFKKGLKRGVLDGFVNVHYSPKSGFSYKIDSTGQEYVKSLSSTYKIQYLSILKNTKQQFGNKSDTELLSIYNQKSLRHAEE